MARFVNDVLEIMRLAISRRNENDTDSDRTTLLRYLNNFISITMSDDVRLFEQFGTLTFSIDSSTTTGVYAFNDLGATDTFSTISGDALISLTTPPTGSMSWYPLEVYQDPGEFFGHWGVRNETVLTRGAPTAMLFYGNSLTFRTLPNTGYTVTIYGYKSLSDFSAAGNPSLPFDRWLRYLAYGAALNYAMDFSYSQEALSAIKASFGRERRLMLTHTHNQIKIQRCMPTF